MKRPRSDNCDDFVDDIIDDELGRASANPRPKKKQKKPMKGVIDSPSAVSAVHDVASPPTVDSKLSSNPPQARTIRSLSFSNDEKGEPESGIVKKQLKYLCSIKEPTVNVGIEMVGAAYLLKLMATKSGDDDDDDKKIERAMKEAVEAAKLLFHADHLRNNALQLLSRSQKLFDEFL